MNFKKILSLLKKPELFERSEEIFWKDPYISEKLLEAHLNPDWEAASRKHSTIEKTVKWLDENVFEKKDSKILDLGCGPGLYASPLAELGYHLTGIDYSRRSIDYASRHAKENGLKIDYIYQNYLKIDYDSDFDVIMLIYCDLGALTNQERDTLLAKIYKALKPGGLFIFDAFKKRSIKILANS
ncbi:class I SAM-dependent methyltransferase [Natronospora cellulosivora (SeqCode)]